MVLDTFADPSMSRCGARSGLTTAQYPPPGSDRQAILPPFVTTAQRVIRSVGGLPALKPCRRNTATKILLSKSRDRRFRMCSIGRASLPRAWIPARTAKRVPCWIRRDCGSIARCAKPSGAGRMVCRWVNVRPWSVCGAAPKRGTVHTGLNGSWNRAGTTGSGSAPRKTGRPYATGLWRPSSTSEEALAAPPCTKSAQLARKPCTQPGPS
ncbi:hypothetical protein SAMN05216376_102175 [Mameliella alba]|nr:hypothetical protein LX94_00956 [Mameliella alba]SDC34725.1 hypothetical protein SAMN05216376_102175 [Mameliella alba]